MQNAIEIYVNHHISNEFTMVNIFIPELLRGLFFYFDRWSSFQGRSES